MHTNPHEFLPFFFPGIRVNSCPFVVPPWIELNREALVADWELALSGETPFKIKPL
jgi:hypothetical protein